MTKMRIALLALVLLLAASGAPLAAQEPEEPPTPPIESVPESPVETAVEATPAVEASPAASPSPLPVRPKLAPGFAKRGEIRDRNGVVLASDAPCWDIGVRYELVHGYANPDDSERADGYVARLVQQKGGSRVADDEMREGLAAKYRRQIAQTFKDLRAVAKLSETELTRRCERAVAQVEGLKAAVARKHGEERAIAEERSFRTLARVTGQEAGALATAKLKDLPWVRFTRSMNRHAADSEPLVHVLGHVGRADARRAAADAKVSDREHALQPGDACGISGVERLGDATLRAWMDAAGTVHPGADATLMIDSVLQRDVYRILERGVKKSPYPCGGAAAIVNVDTGEIHALVSYPAYPTGLSPAQFAELADDTRWTPLRFRAVSNVFPPGSTIKPATLYASLAEGAVTTATRVPCSGEFRKDMPNMFRCWVYNRTGDTHGIEDGETALRDSCNIYFFSAGDKLGAKPLMDHFERFGLGISQGTGLIEEAGGLLPTEAWVAKNRPKPGKYWRSDAWSYAFGQGELGVTTIQMANFAATLARGRFAPVTLMRDAKGARIGSERPLGPVFKEPWISVVRRGLWRVVNEKGGTAYDARLKTPQAILVGKTGSAQAVARAVMRSFELVLPDGTKRKVEAPTPERAKKILGIPGAKVVAQPVSARYPDLEEGQLPAHAWFIGYTQPPDTKRGDGPGPGSYALCVLVEYGGAGGEVAAPIARDVARRVVQGPGNEPAPKVSRKPKKKKKAASPPPPPPDPLPEADEVEDTED
jgi:cell division protein FtsI/penicillin-binding protein 2